MVQTSFRPCYCLRYEDKIVEHCNKAITLWSGDVNTLVIFTLKSQPSGAASGIGALF